MKLFGFTIGKEKPVSFPEFRDSVRLAVRRQSPNARVENSDEGLILTMEGKPRQACSLRNLYRDYTRAPKDKEGLIQRWISALVVEIPEHGWMEAQITLRPTLKHMNSYIAIANTQMKKANPPDSLPYLPFLGDLGVIVMRDLPGTAVAVTQAMLDAWGVTLEQAMQAAIMNMNMLSFPNVANALVAGGASKKGDQEEVGLVFEDNHLTATWLIIERFRDYLTQRLQGDYVVAVPLRNRLVAIRADEPGLISQIQATNRNFDSQAHNLTTQCFHVSGSRTGGVVSIYQPGLNSGEAQTLDANSMFAHGNSATLPTPGIQPTPSRPTRPAPVDLSAWGGLSESTREEPRTPTPFDRGKR